MAAHLREILRERCQTCGKYATHTLYNTWNAPLGAYCRTHSRQALREFVKRHPEQGGGEG